MNENLNIKHYKIPIYKQTLVIIKTDYLNEIPEKWKPEDFNTHGFEAMAYKIQTGTGYNYYCLAFTENKIKVIIHECFHLMNILFNDRNIDYNYNNDEHAAYLLEWLVEKCINFFNSIK